MSYIKYKSFQIGAVICALGAIFGNAGLAFAGTAIALPLVPIGIVLMLFPFTRSWVIKKIEASRFGQKFRLRFQPLSNKKR